MATTKKHFALDASSPSEAVPHELGGPARLTKVFATTNSETPVMLQIMDGSEETGLKHFLTKGAPLAWDVGRTLPWDAGNAACQANDLMVSASGLPTGTGVIFIDLEYGVG